METTTQAMDGGHPDYHSKSTQFRTGPASFADLEDAVQELRNSLGADGYAVCRTRRFAQENEDRVSVVFSSLDEAMRGVISILGGVVQQHMEHSLLPFSWQSADGGGHITGPFIQPLSLASTGPGGVGFPVRLGVMGNGFLVFFGSRLDLSGDRIVEFHRDAFRLMLGLLKLDVRKTVPRENLNDRELQCLQLAADGYKSEAIAKELRLSVHTVNAYLGFAADKLDAVNRIQAIAKAIRLGLIG